MSEAVEAIPIRSLRDPLDEIASARLAEHLPSYVASQRWFRAKTRTITRIEIADVLEMRDISAQILILHLHYADGEHDRYILPVSVAGSTAEGRPSYIARLALTGNADEAVLFSSLEDPAFRGAVLRAIACNETIPGRAGSLSAERTGALAEDCSNILTTNTDSFVSRAEQSNTSIIFRDRYILKLFRKLENGVNPDLEIGAFLTSRKFRNTPAVLGSILYRSTQPAEEPSAVAILQQFVPNEGDAWKYTLDTLEGFFQKALASGGDPPKRSSEHPLELMGEAIPPDVQAFIGPYLESAALLGKRTAEMHRALASGKDVPDFAPEPFKKDHGRELYRELKGQADLSFELMRRKLDTFEGSIAGQGRQLLALEPKVESRFKQMEKFAVTVPRIRHHGDYHLGQVLYTRAALSGRGATADAGGDFMIIDFEGEPARPLADRRAKALAMRDVAGMVRSFQYAAYAALFGQVPGVTITEGTRAAIENWAAAWNAYVSAHYLQAYFAEAHNEAFVPASDVERRLLLDAFLLQKALYELAYELNNRPDWLPIPLRGILSLMP